MLDFTINYSRFLGFFSIVLAFFAVMWGYSHMLRITRTS